MHAFRVRVQFADLTERVIPRYATNWDAHRTLVYFKSKYPNFLSIDIDTDRHIAVAHASNLSINKGDGTAP